MSSTAIGILMIAILLVLLLLRVPVAFALAITGFAGYWLIAGLEPALIITGTSMYDTIAKYSFAVVPLFVIMGYFSYHSGIVTQLFNTSKKWVGHLPGGLVQATILGGAGFGAASGSGFASTATLAKITIPEMIQAGVDKKLAYGAVASVGPLAQMIPPSVLMVIVAIITNQNIGKMLIGGILPGILAALVYMILVAILVKRNPSLAPPVSKASWSERIKSIKNVWSFTLVVAMMIAGMYSGFFTATEAGAVGAAAVFILVLVKRGFKWSVFKEALIDTMKTTSMVFLIVGSAFIFGYFLGITRIPAKLSEFLVNLPVAPIIILIGIVIMYLILGMFVDMMAAMFLTLPIIFPAILSLGYDPIWFGVLLVFLAEVSLVTPPFGISLFIIKGTIPDSNFEDIMKGSIPFVVADLVIIALLIMFPEIVTFLPSLMK